MEEEANRIWRIFFAKGNLEIIQFGMANHQMGRGGDTAIMEINGRALEEFAWRRRKKSNLGDLRFIRMGFVGGEEHILESKQEEECHIGKNIKNWHKKIRP
jgi:hypothetical protein